MSGPVSNRPISDVWFHRVKSATRDLVRLCGGVVRAGEVAGVSKSEVSRWQSAADNDVISLPAALALEAECGMPLVTSAMAEVQGRRVSDPREAEVTGCLIGAYTGVLSGNAELQQAMAHALADGTVTPAEADVIGRNIGGLEGALVQLKQALAGVKADGAVSLRVVTR